MMRALRNHPAVTRAVRDGAFAVHVERGRWPPLRLYVCNVYEIGVADVEEILDEEPETNAIVTVSAWNRYSPQAKALAADFGVGLFKPKELLGALHKEGRAFIEHLSAEQREEQRRRRRPR